MSDESSIEMSLFKDVELGDPDPDSGPEESHLPLLVVEENGDQRQDEAARPQSSNTEGHVTGAPPNHNQPQMSRPRSSNSAALAEAVKIVTQKNRIQKRLNTELLEAVENNEVEEVIRLLKDGANPNATCRLDLVSACHLAALSMGDCLFLLLKSKALKNRLDIHGRSPLHIAAFLGHTRQVAVLLGLPKYMHKEIEKKELPSHVIDYVKKKSIDCEEIINAICDPEMVPRELPSDWQVNFIYKCQSINDTLAPIQPGWTPLHAAASTANLGCVQLLLAASAVRNIPDKEGRTALDVAGSEFYNKKDIESNNFTNVIKVLLDAGGTYNTMKANGINNLNTPLHTAVELDNMEVIKQLLEAGVSIGCLNVDGLTPLHICVKKKQIYTFIILATYAQNNSTTGTVDVRDKRGQTVLQAAIEATWIPGVCKALEIGADVTLKDDNGENLMHTAASSGRVDVLVEIFNDSKQSDLINGINNKGETPLFKAISSNHIECVKFLLHNGASILKTLPGDLNVLHVASEKGHKDILEVLLNFDEEATQMIINDLSTQEDGRGPVHLAVINNHPDCMEILLSKDANIKLKTRNQELTSLHFAVEQNNSEIAKKIIKCDDSTIHELNRRGWSPLHTAAYHGHGEVFILLLKKGADLSAYTDAPKKTAADIFVNNMMNPTYFLNALFDTYISSNCINFLDSECKITINYDILMPTNSDKEEMRVIEALLNTGNRYNQRQLLLNPLIESFLYLKWKALLPFFYTIIAINSAFVLSFTFFIISVFFYKDKKETSPIFWDEILWGYIAFAMICLMFLQEFLFMNVNPRKYLSSLETWVKIISVSLATATFIATKLTVVSTVEWIRHIATLALLLSWLELMFLLSRFPNWGYYVLMFEKVAGNVMKILFTFAFLLIGFALSFMMEFHTQVPFENPWVAFVKTMVMMTSEFDYMPLFNPDDKENLPPSLNTARLIFLSFLILAAIVLMNLLVGVAVNNINDLENLGNIHRLAKQVEFLGTLEKLVNNKYFNEILPKRIYESFIEKKSVLKKITLYPGQPQRHNTVGLQLPSNIQDALMVIASNRIRRRYAKTSKEIYSKKINAIHDALVSKKNIIENECDINKCEKLNKTGITKRDDDNLVDSVDTQIIHDIKVQFEELLIRIGLMAKDIKETKQFIVK